MAQERHDYQVPPTRPSTPTPLNREPRIAEAPSRADPNPPFMETSSPPYTATTLVAFEQRDHVNGDLTQDIEERSDPAPSVSPSIHFLNIYLLPPCRNRVAFAPFPSDRLEIDQNLPPFAICAGYFLDRSCLQKNLDYRPFLCHCRRAACSRCTNFQDSPFYRSALQISWTEGVFKRPLIFSGRLPVRPVLLQFSLYLCIQVDISFYQISTITRANSLKVFQPSLAIERKQS
jgi:hypothetical protein